MTEKEVTLTDGDRGLNTPACQTNATGNCSNNEAEWIALYDSTPEAIIVPCVFAAILVVGVIGNALLILSFARHKTLTMAHNALVVNLASGDFIFLVVSLPFNSVWYTLPYWPFGLVVCKVSHFAENLATAVVITTLSVLSVERCLIVTGKRLWSERNKNPLVLTITIWMFALTVSTPNLFSADIATKVINGDKYTFCHLYRSDWGKLYAQIHVASKFILLFCLPLLVITSAYVIIAVHLLLRAFPVSSHKRNSRRYQQEMPSKKNTKDSNSAGGANAGSGTGDSKQGDAVSSVTQQNKQEDSPAGSFTHAQQSPRTSSSASKHAVAPPSGNRRSMDYTSVTEFTTEITEVGHQSQTLPPVLGDAEDEYISEQNHSSSLEPQTLQGGNDEKSSERSSSVKDNLNRKIVSSKTQRSNSSSPSKDFAISRAPGSGGHGNSTKETTPLNPAMLSREKPRRETAATKRRRLAITVLSLIAAFAVCWAPRHAYLLWYHFDPGNFDDFWYAFKILGFCLSFSNSAVNPLVFYVLDSKYRSFVHSALCGVCMRQCKPTTEAAGMPLLTMGDRDYNATIAVTDSKVRNNITQV
ncbi:neuropeptide CCHamide-2 receptor [Aplysia californica]|uniref:Neuropeptide CCHamide-2 receptor n=1 Tax=Aplysia californica TaxID=6500 RepID=A0ABM0JPQ5_APLCA|nr:neuropeptide CCHamide-2 receptor [Aplysia californica]